MMGRRSSESHIFLAGGIFSIVALFGIVADIVTSMLLGLGTNTPVHSIRDIFHLLNENCWVGLYSLDLLNTVLQIAFIPVFFALYTAHRKKEKYSALLAMVLFLVGTTVMVSGNSALAMLELSNKYEAGYGSQKGLMLAAGEALLAKGAHGSPGMFIGFILPTFANIYMSFIMIKGQVFSKLTAYVGISGNGLLLAYVTLRTFFSGFESLKTILSMVGGLLVTIWIIRFANTLFRLAVRNKAESLVS